MSATSGNVATMYVLNSVTERKVEDAMKHVAFHNHGDHRFGFGGLRGHGVNLLVPHFQHDHNSQRTFSSNWIGEYDDESPPG